MGAAGEEMALLTDRDGRSPSHGAKYNERNLAHHPRTFFISGRAHHGPGSIGVPSLRNSTYRTGCAAPMAIAAAVFAEPSPMVATGSPVRTNCPTSTLIRSMPASTT